MGAPSIGDLSIGSEDLSAGDRVELHGLKGGAEHNGKCGLVTGSQGDERLKVLLDAADGKTLALKPANLARLDGPDRDEAYRIYNETTDAFIAVSQKLASRSAKPTRAKLEELGANFSRALQFYGPGLTDDTDVTRRAHLLASKAGVFQTMFVGKEGLPESEPLARASFELGLESFDLAPKPVAAFVLARSAAVLGSSVHGPLDVNEIQRAIEPLYAPLEWGPMSPDPLRSHLLQDLFKAQWAILRRAQGAGPGEVASPTMPVIGGGIAVELLDAREAYARAGPDSRDLAAARVLAAQAAIDDKLPADKIQAWPPLDEQSSA